MADATDAANTLVKQRSHILIGDGSDCGPEAINVTVVHCNTLA